MNEWMNECMCDTARIEHVSRDGIQNCSDRLRTKIEDGADEADRKCTSPG